MPAPDEVLQASGRGAIAAMAMTGMRAFTAEAGLVRETPPKAIFRRQARGALRAVPRKRRRAAIELAHWGYGAGGGAMFGLLPDGVRRRRWAGVVYGVVLWLGFELCLAPLLGLKRGKPPKPAERAALAADHALYGFVLGGTQPRPQD
jgi:hypothetical protein